MPRAGTRPSQLALNINLHNPTTVKMSTFAARRGLSAPGALLGACAFFVMPAFAQDQTGSPLDTVTVIGSRLAPETMPLAATTTLDRAEIEARNKASVPELLADVVGVHSTQPGDRGSVGEVILRGGEPNFTAILVDGVQMNDPTNTRGGSFDFSTLDVDEIERIEILRGPLSSVYGSDALSGVINIITHEPDETLAGRMSISLGGEDFAAASARLGGRLVGDSSFSLGAATLRDGRSSSDSGVRSTSLNGKLALLERDDVSLSAEFRHTDSELHAFPESSGGPELSVLSAQESRTLDNDTYAVTWRKVLSPSSALHVQLASSRHAAQNRSPGVAAGPGGQIPANSASTDFDRDSASAYLTSTLGSGIESAYGFSYVAEDGASAGEIEFAPGLSAATAYSLARTDRAIFGELRAAMMPGLIVDAALRYDDNGSAQSETTGRLGLSLVGRDGALRLRLGHATGFKRPSLFALGDPLTGNSTLVSEHVSSWELSTRLSLRNDRLVVDAAVFTQDFENLIDFDFEQFMSVNRDRVSTDGIELAVSYRPAGNVMLSAHGTWLDTAIAGSDESLRLRPDARGGAGIEWRASPSLTVFAGLRHVGARIDESIPTGVGTLPSYTRADASLSWALRPTLSVQFAIDNVTDERIYDAIGFPSLGTRARVTFRASLGALR
jgi:vitamin B12 transporter